MSFRSLSHDQFDRDAEVQSEARVVNVSPDVARFEIGATPGSPPRRYKLAPHGQQGSGVSLQIGYTVETKGVGRSMIQPTIEQLTEREVYPNGPRLPQVVAEGERAEYFRQKWLEAIANRGKAGSKSVLLRTTDGSDLEVTIPLPGARAVAKPEHQPGYDDDIEDQTGEPVDPDPDNDPDATPDPAIAVPAARQPRASRARSAARGKA